MSEESTQAAGAVERRRVCVIGAGTAGLCALKHCLEQGFDATAYEQCAALGGTWLYAEAPADPFVKVQSSMYEDLRTNLPKEVMGFPDFAYPRDLEESFITAEQVLDFLKSYAEHFKLYEHIEFEREVLRVRPRIAVDKDGYEVTIRDVLHDTYETLYYDYIFVCNGHFSEPDVPAIEGAENFRGLQMHSHCYRKASAFKDKQLLVIGAGPSGIDITNHVRKEAKQIFLSHHLTTSPNTAFMPNVTQKPDVERLTEHGAVFKDGSEEQFDCIMYCTGYKYTFSCLSTDVRIRVIDNFVQPLWKHCININFPTMAIIGLPSNVIPTQCFDLQVRFALKYYVGSKRFPKRAEMIADLEQETGEKWDCGIETPRNRTMHTLGDDKADKYFNDLSQLAEIENIKPVVMKIKRECGKKYIYELDSYRNYCYKIIDDESFVKFEFKSKDL